MFFCAGTAPRLLLLHCSQSFTFLRFLCVFSGCCHYRLRYSTQDNSQLYLCCCICVYAIARLTLFLCCFVHIRHRCCRFLCIHIYIDVYVVALFYFSTWANCYSTTSCCSLVMLCVAFAYYVFKMI